MSMKEKMAEAANQVRNKTVVDTYESLKDTDEWQSKNKTQRLYMLCIACDATHPVIQSVLKEVGIEL